MPIIDFTQPFYLIAAVVLFLLCFYLAKNNKSNTVTCIMLLCFLAILVCHTVELTYAELEYVDTLATCILVDEIFTLIDNINREEYYINMGVSWLISISLIKYKDKTLEYLKTCNLNDFTYNKALQKARESLRVSKEDKDYYQSLKRK